MKAHSKSIQRALQAYNQVALALDPPRPKLTWTQIVEYSTIAEFELLRVGARVDIRNLEWANARNREAGVCHTKMLRAKEEITRLNIEIKRLSTWITHEQEQLNHAIETCEDLLLKAAITSYAEERIRVNTNLQTTLFKIYSLRGFSGDSSIGQRESGVMGLDLEASSIIDSDRSDSSDDDGIRLLDDVYEGIERLSLE